LSSQDACGYTRQTTDDPRRHGPEPIDASTGKRPRWVAEEQWHPRQEGRFLQDGSYELKVPYGDSRELLGDLLRHGAGVEVIAPASLRAEVIAKLSAALAVYGETQLHAAH